MKKETLKELLEELLSQLKVEEVTFNGVKIDKNYLEQEDFDEELLKQAYACFKWFGFPNDWLS